MSEEKTRLYRHASITTPQVQAAKKDAEKSSTVKRLLVANSAVRQMYNSNLHAMRWEDAHQHVKRVATNMEENGGAKQIYLLLELVVPKLNSTCTLFTCHFQILQHLKTRPVKL